MECVLFSDDLPLLPKLQGTVVSDRFAFRSVYNVFTYSKCRPTPLIDTFSPLTGSQVHGGRPRLDRGSPGRLPARHAVRLPGASPGQQPPLHGAVRPTRQPLQREDLHVSVVLDRGRGRRQCSQLRRLAGARVAWQRSRAVRRQPAAPAQSGRAEGPRDAHVRAQLPATRWRLPVASDRAQHRQHHDDGCRLLAVGQVEEAHVEERHRGIRAARTAGAGAKDG